MTKFVRLLLGLCFGMLLLPAASAADAREYVLGSGDIIRVTVFQNPDLTVETRVTENGSITYPLIGGVTVGGLTLPATEKLIADKLRDGSVGAWGRVIMPRQPHMSLDESRRLAQWVLSQPSPP